MIFYQTEKHTSHPEAWSMDVTLHPHKVGPHKCRGLDQVESSVGHVRQNVFRDGCLIEVKRLGQECGGKDWQYDHPSTKPLIYPWPLVSMMVLGSLDVEI